MLNMDDKIGSTAYMTTPVPPQGKDRISLSTPLPPRKNLGFELGAPMTPTNHLGLPCLNSGRNPLLHGLPSCRLTPRRIKSNTDELFFR
jgi:hypothetical protein